MDRISYIEAQKIDNEIKDKFWEKEENFNWIWQNLIGKGCCDGVQKGDNIFSLIKVLNEWKKNPPSKEVLDDLKYTINNHEFKSLGSFLRILGNYLSDDCYFNQRKHLHTALDEEIYELIKLLIYFGMKITKEEKDNFIYKISKKISGLSKIINVFK